MATNEPTLDACRLSYLCEIPLPEARAMLAAVAEVKRLQSAFDYLRDALKTYDNQDEWTKDNDADAPHALIEDVRLTVSNVFDPTAIPK